MKINGKNFPLFPVSVLFVVLYIFTATQPVEKALDIKPEWTVTINGHESKQIYGKEKKIPFRLGKLMGYYDEDGTIISLIPVEKRGAISADFWTLYDRDAENTAFFTPDNEQSGILDTAGFPFFSGNAVFVFHPGGTSFSRHDTTGKTLWQYESYVPITAFHASAAGTAVGFADGNAVCLDTEGNIIADFYPGGSDTQVIFGTALSEDGKYCACLCGLNSQRIVVTELDKSKVKIIYHEYLKDELTEQTLVRFAGNNTHVFFNTKSGLISVSTDKKKSFFIPLEGKVLSLSEFAGKDIFFVLSKAAGVYTVTLLSDGRYNRGAFSFEAGAAFLYTENADIYVGADDRISKMTLGFN